MEKCSRHCRWSQCPFRGPSHVNALALCCVPAASTIQLQRLDHCHPNATRPHRSWVTPTPPTAVEAAAASHAAAAAATATATIAAAPYHSTSPSLAPLLPLAHHQAAVVSTSGSSGPVDSPDLEAQLPRVSGFGTSHASTAGTTTADGSHGSRLPLISLDQPKQGNSAEALHLYGEQFAQLIQHDIPLQEDLVFASRPPPQQSLSLLGSGQAVAAAAAALVALSHPMSISPAVGLKDMSSLAAPLAQHKSRLDTARLAMDTAHPLAKKRTTLRAAAAQQGYY